MGGRWMGPAAAAALIAVVGCVEPSPRGEPAPREVAVEHYQRAMRLIEDQEIDQAMVAIRRAIAANPTYAVYHYVYGNLLAQKQQYLEAELEYQAATRSDPLHDPSWEGRIQMALAQGDKDRVPGIIRERVRVSPLEAGWRLRLGLAHEALGDLIAAERELKAAADLAKGAQAAEAHARLGVVYEALGRPTAAIREYEESLKVNPNQPDLIEIVNRLKGAPRAGP